MLRWRLLLGTVMIAALAGLSWADYHAEIPGAWLFPLAILASGLGAGEMIWLARQRDAQPLAWVVYSGTLLIVAANAVPMFCPAAVQLSPGSLGWPVLGLAIGVLLAIVGEIQRYERPGGVTVSLASSVFAMAYVGLLLSFAVQLRLLGEGPAGLLALVSLILVVKISDIGAYTVGRLLGRHKLAPVVSPGKTWEGAAGGLLFALVGSFFVFQLWLPRLELPGGDKSVPGWGWIAYAVLITVAGMLGDLGESLLKRDAGCKDSSTWLPGFGGVLDLLDSILAASPVAYLCWVLGLVGA